MEWIGNVSAIVAVVSALISGVVVSLANVYFNSRGVTLIVQKAANEAASAVVEDMRKFVQELRVEIERKDEIINQLRTEVKELRTEVNNLRSQMTQDTKDIISEVKKH